MKRGRKGLSLCKRRMALSEVRDHFIYETFHTDLSNRNQTPRAGTQMLKNKTKEIVIGNPRPGTADRNEREEEPRDTEQSKNKIERPRCVLRASGSANAHSWVHGLERGTSCRPPPGDPAEPRRQTAPREGLGEDARARGAPREAGAARLPSDNTDSRQKW